MPKFAKFRSIVLPLMLTAGVVGAAPAHASGDLLVAPTRVVLEGQRGTEIILNNIGAETETYRISLELRRMTPQGDLAEVTEEEANVIERAAKSMIRYAPRRVTLPPGQPQTIRLGIRPPADLPDGEYRVHMLFRGVPKAKAVTEVQQTQNLSISLTPIYGITIPIIVRMGQLEGAASIANARIEAGEQAPELTFDLSRTGQTSIYGEVLIRRPGNEEPLFEIGGIAIYPELDNRTVRLPISNEIAAQLKGPVVIEYREPVGRGGGLIAKVEQVLR